MAVGCVISYKTQIYSQVQFKGFHYT